MWDEWKHIFLTVADRHAPPITKKVSMLHGLPVKLKI